MANDCGSCVHFDAHAGKQQSDGHQLGLCRRFPPHANFGFPKVRADGGCGEYKFDHEKDCCNRNSPDESHAPGCKSLEVQEVKSEEQEK